ncbi:hypothetical protein [Ideonella sp. YS5]|uniref:hypothetical protein n=1 Tax=Ideonella sp. YS5 TaxID=3453714 RepID=UPI003EEF2653
MAAVHRPQGPALVFIHGFLDGAAAWQAAAPTPLLMVVATHDTITLTDLELAAYEKALQPKRLVTIEGGHFAPYLSKFDAASTAAIEWFEQQLA